FTWMLLCGPPQIWIDGLPCRSKDCESVGCVTRIGTGEMICTMAAAATALTFVEETPNIFISVVRTERVIVTRTAAVGKLGDSETPGMDAGRSTVTVS